MAHAKHAAPAPAPASPPLPAALVGEMESEMEGMTEDLVRFTSMLDFIDKHCNDEEGYAIGAMFRPYAERLLEHVDNLRGAWHELRTADARA